VDIVICAERASRYIEEECIRRLGIGESRIKVGKRVFVRVKKGIWGGNEESVKVAELKRVE